MAETISGKATMQIGSGNEPIWARCTFRAVCGLGEKAHAVRASGLA